MCVWGWGGGGWVGGGELGGGGKGGEEGRVPTKHETQSVSTGASQVNIQTTSIVEYDSRSLTIRKI